MQKEKLWNKNYNKVMLTNFTLFFSFYLITPLLPLYLSETFSASKDTIGMVLSGYTLVALIVRLFSGYMVDNFARKTVLLIVLFVYFIFFGSYLIAGSLLAFTIFRTLHGGPFGATTVANSTMAIDVLPSSRRNEGIGFYGMSNNLASAIAPTVGLFIYKYTHNFELMFWLAFIIAGIGFVNTYTLDVKNEKPKDRTKFKFSLDRFFLTRGWFLAINICFFGFCWGVLSNYLAIYGKEHLGITSGTGTYFLLLSIGLIVSRFQGNKALRQGKLTQNAQSGIILSTFGFGIFIAGPWLLDKCSCDASLNYIPYYLSSILIGLGNGHMWPAFQNMIIAIAHHNERGTANSTILTSWDFGLGVGILLGGVIAEYLGYDAMFWVMAAVHVIGLAMYLFNTQGNFLKLQKQFEK